MYPKKAFDTAWQWLRLKLTEADFTEFRLQRAFDAWKHTMLEAGLKLLTQVADGRFTRATSSEHIEVSLLKATVTKILDDQTARAKAAFVRGDEIGQGEKEIVARKP